jgi:hypothetical protein
VPYQVEVSHEKPVAALPFDARKGAGGVVATFRAF